MTDERRAEIIKRSFPALGMIEDRGLAGKIVACWVRIWKESKWPDLGDCPFNPHFPDVPLKSHINCVAELTLACREVLEKYNDRLTLNRDFLLTGVLLHDLSKMVEIEPGPDGPVFSELNDRMPHSTYGAMVALSEGLDADVANIILSHTKLTGAVPNSPEAVLLHYLDYGMADVLRARDGLPLLMVAGSKFGKK